MHLDDQIREAFGLPPDADLSGLSKLLSVFIGLVLEAGSLSHERTTQLKGMHEYLDSHKELDVTNAKEITTRSALHRYLKKNPLYSKLRLLPADVTDDTRDTQGNRKAALLAQLYLKKGASDYAACLLFYKCFLSPEGSDISLTRHYILDASHLDLKIELEKLAKSEKSEKLRKFSLCFKSDRAYRVQKDPTRSITKADNYHDVIVSSDDEASIIFTQGTNTEGRETSSYLQVVSKVPLTDEQQRRKFQRKKTGMKNAIFNTELALAFSIQSATASEVGLLLDSIHPGFLTLGFSDLLPLKAKRLLILVLEILGITEPLKLGLFNEGAKQEFKRTSRCIAYQFKSKKGDEDKHIIANLILPGRLLDTKTPEVKDTARHYAANEWWKFKLPLPIGSLLNIVLRSINSEERKNTTLGKATGLDPSDYSSWLHRAIGDTALKERGITRSAIQKSFHYFAKEKMPEPCLALLQGKATVQSHYLNIDRALLNGMLDDTWRIFCENMGFERLDFNTHEATRTSRSSFYSDTEIGSPITIKDKVLWTILSGLVERSQFDPGLDLNQCASRLNLLVFYIYLRIATTVGLRPVTEPLPSGHHFDDQLGLMTVSDKRVHGKDERRLIVLTPRLCEMLKSAAHCMKAASLCLQIKEPDVLLMTLQEIGQSDTEEMSLQWQHLSQKVVNTMLEELTSEKLINHSLRHHAVRAFVIEHQRDFSQSALNLLLNHSRAGVSVLNARGLLTIEQIAEIQREKLTPLERRHKEHDEQVLELLSALTRRFAA